MAAEDEGFVSIGVDLLEWSQSLAQLARTTTDSEAFRRHVACLRFNQEPSPTKKDSSKNKRPSEETVENQRAKDGNDISRRTRASKIKRLVQTEIHKCEYCDNEYAVEAALKNHLKTHTSSNITKTKTYKCTLCPKERCDIYKHYISEHKIEYTEQILLYNGRTLVYSAIDTGSGKAAWFLNEKEKAIKKYAREDEENEFTCRLCDVEIIYQNTEILADHYTLFHKVDPASLDNLKRMFRFEIGAHLIDMPDSHSAGKSRQRVSSSQRQSKPMSRISDGETKRKIDASGSTEHKKKKPAKEFKHNINGLIIYQCEECEVATTTYDASVEHAQMHHLKGYIPITETCDVCHLAFEAQCFAVHSSNHGDKDEQKMLRYNPSNLLNDEWFTIFQGLPETFANQIKSSSIYKHTRAVKINSDEVSGIPLYQCGMCELYVHPKEVEHHCNNKNACIKNKSQDYYCSECDIFFYSSVAITEHNKEHKNGHAINDYRKASFNYRQDGPVNRALQQLSSKSCSLRQASLCNETVLSPVEESPVGTQQGNRQPIEIIEDRIVSLFCELCNKSVMCSEFEAHAATHESYQNVPHENEDSQLVEKDVEENYDDITYDHECLTSRNVASQNEAIVIMGSNEDTYEQGNSDSDSYPYTMQVEVHVHREDVQEDLQKNHEQLADRNNQTDKNVEDVTDDATKTEDNNSKTNSVPEKRNTQGGTNNIFSEEMVKDLESDIHNLLQEIKSGIRKSSAAADENLTTQDLLNILEDNTTKRVDTTVNNETDESSQVHKNKEEIHNNKDKLTESNENEAISQDIFASDPIESQKHNTDPEISMELFNETVKTEKNYTIINRDADENASNVNNIIEIINLDTDDEDDVTESNSRPSSRIILSGMVTNSDSNELCVVDDPKGQSMRQILINETQRIRELMSSRD